MEEPSRLQHLGKRLHQFGFVHRVHALIYNFKQTVARLLPQLLYRHVAQQEIHKSAHTTYNLISSTLAGWFK